MEISFMCCIAVTAPLFAQNKVLLEIDGAGFKNTRLTYTSETINNKKTNNRIKGSKLKITIPLHCVFSIGEEKE